MRDVRDGGFIGKCACGQRRVLVVAGSQALFTLAVIGTRFIGVVRGPAPLSILHRDAVHRTGRHAKVASRAQIWNHRVHELVCAHNGVNRTRLYAQGTANAMRFVNDGDLKRARQTP